VSPAEVEQMPARRILYWQGRAFDFHTIRQQAITRYVNEQKARRR
jgi:hypothetical protein